MSLDQQAAHNLPLEVHDLIEQMGLLTGATPAAPLPWLKEHKR
jgi:hypothetical protein